MKTTTQECSTEPQAPSHLRMMKTQRSNPNTRLPPATRNVCWDMEADSCTEAVGSRAVIEKKKGGD